MDLENYRVEYIIKKTCQKVVNLRKVHNIAK
jgi:hypothetical protein